MGCCLGGGDDKVVTKEAANESTPLNKTKGKASKESVSDSKVEHIEFETGKSKLKLPFYVQTPIIKKNNNEIILLYTERNTTKYNILNINDCKLGETVELKCDDTFDVYNTVYALNKNDNKIYFIENNANILTLDLNENEIVSLNKTITTSNDNYAQIIYNDATSKLYIFGGEEKSDQDDNYELVPYSLLTVNKGDGPEPKVKGFGQYSRIMNVTRDNTDYIYIFGGVSVAQELVSPADQLLMYQLGDCSGQRYVTRFTAQPMFRMGTINYDNRYIITFGGTIIKSKKVVDEANSTYVYTITDQNKGKDIRQETWYELSKKLKVKGKSEGKYYFNAILIDGIIHFISYGGKYYTMKMKNILDEIDIGSAIDQTQGLIFLQESTQQGKTVTPTKSTTVKAMGPKEEDK